jgi:hypothetical protein
MNHRHKSRAESKSRNSGRVVSFMLHALLLLVLFLPIFAMKPPEEPTKEALVIQFDYPYNQYVKPEVEKFEELENTDMASKMSGSEAGGSTADEEPQHSRPQQAAPTRLASPSMTAVSNTQTTSSALRTNIGEIPMPAPKIVTPQKWQSVSDYGTFESDGVEEMKLIDSGGGFGDVPGEGTGDGDDDSHVSSEGFGTSPGGTGGQSGGTGSTNGTGSGPGGGTGAGSAGKNTGVGQDGNGLAWGVGLDEGFLSRELVRRANVGSLAVKEGKVSILICVDRSGMVISSKYDFAGSTLKEPAFAAKAEACASSYIFARDDDAPEKQCGKLAFIFKIK